MKSRENGSGSGSGEGSGSGRVEARSGGSVEDGSVSDGERSRSCAARSATGSSDGGTFRDLPSETDADIRAEGAGSGRVARTEGRIGFGVTR